MDQVGHGHIFAVGTTVSGQESQGVQPQVRLLQEREHLFLVFQPPSHLLYSSRPNVLVSDGDGLAPPLHGPEYVCSAKTTC